MEEQSICAQTEHVTEVSLCDQINMPFKSETEQIGRNDNISCQTLVLDLRSCELPPLSKQLS